MKLRYTFRFTPTAPQIRADFLHKTTTELVERLGVIAIEDLHGGA